jgi:hypothetical protein
MHRCTHQTLRKGVLECWSVGVLEYWSIGVLEYWSTGVLEAGLSRMAPLGEWLLSRRDSTIVARHEVPGFPEKLPVPEGRSKSSQSQGDLSSKLGPCRFRSVQSSRWDMAILSHDSRHFVPGYYRAVPPGQNTFQPPRLFGAKARSIFRRREE